MNARKLRHIILRLIQIAICLFILVHIIPIPINKVYRAKEIKMGDPSYMEDCTITIEGYYYFNVTEHDVFEGKLVLSSNHLTADSPIKLSFRSPRDYDTSIVYKRYGEDGKLPSSTNSYYLGNLFQKPLMRSICIILFDNDTYDRYGNVKPDAPPYRTGGSWSPLESYCVVASVDSRQEALEQLYRYGIISTLEGR